MIKKVREIAKARLPQDKKKTMKTGDSEEGGGGGDRCDMY